MAIQYSRGKKTAAAKTRLITGLCVGVIVGVSSGAIIRQPDIAFLLGWGAASLTYLIWMWTTVYRLDDRLTREFAIREDPSRHVADVVLVLASVISLGAVLEVLLNGSRHSGLPVALSVLSVVMSWLLIHTLFMLRYAEVFYHQDNGAIDFPGTKEPTFRDFAYLAFTMGMTYQVSDTTFRSSEFRGIALRHGLLSYLFGTVIVATTINLVISLGGM